MATAGSWASKKGYQYQVVVIAIKEGCLAESVSFRNAAADKPWSSRKTKYFALCFLPLSNWLTLLEARGQGSLVDVAYIVIPKVEKDGE